MKRSIMQCIAAMSLALAAASAPAQPTSLVITGNQWMSSSTDERRAFLAGAVNMIMLESAYAKKNNLPLPPASAALTRGADTVRLADVESRITQWYEANPGSLSKPVMVLMWQEFGKR
jgi:hypothetical protein